MSRSLIFIYTYLLYINFIYFISKEIITISLSQFCAIKSSDGCFFATFTISILHDSRRSSTRFSRFSLYIRTCDGKHEKAH